MRADQLPRPECYERWDLLKSQGEAVTDDGLLVKLSGDKGNPRSQLTLVTDGEATTVKQGAWGSELLSLALAQHRHRTSNH